MHQSEGLFERELVAMMRRSPYSVEDLSRLVRTPTSDLCEQAQWLRLIAVQAGIEFTSRTDASSKTS